MQSSIQPENVNWISPPDPHAAMTLDEFAAHLNWHDISGPARHLALSLHFISEGSLCVRDNVRFIALAMRWTEEQVLAVLDELSGVITLIHREPPPKPKESKSTLRQVTIGNFGHRCSYCEKAGDEVNGPDGRPWCLDRVIPGQAGGDYTEKNVTLSCWACNSRRGASPIERRVYTTYEWDFMFASWWFTWVGAHPAAREAIS